MTDSNQLKVSVIIPAYNAQEYLRECLESVLAQSFKQWEAIVVDDGSTDGTSEIARNFAEADSRFKVVSTANRGQAAARNEGLTRAVGEYIFFIDSDDLIHPLALAYFVEKALAYPENSIICGKFIRMTKRRADQFLRTEPRDVPDLRFTPNEAICDMLYQRHLDSSVCGKLIPTAIFADIRFKENTWYEDLEIVPRILEKAVSVIVTGFDGYFYRITPGSFMHTLTPRQFHLLDVTAEFDERYRNDNLLARAARDRRFSACCNMFALLSISSPTDTTQDFTSTAEKVKRECWKYIKKHRKEILLSGESRIKNRLGALLTLAGKRVFLLVASFIYR